MQDNNCVHVVEHSIYVTQSEKTDHVLRSTKNEIMILFISMSTSFLLYSSYQNLKRIGAVISEL